PASPTDATHEAFRGGGGRETGAGDVASPSFEAGTGTNPGIGRWSAGRRRPLRHWGCASRVAGPAGHARAARAGPFAKAITQDLTGVEFCGIVFSVDRRTPCAA